MSGQHFTGRALPFLDWPERDRRAWLEAQKGDDGYSCDLLNVDLVASNWRASSKELFVRCYGIWLNWLDSQGLLDPEEAPEARVTRSRLAAYMQAERGLGNGAKTLVNHAVSLRHMLGLVQEQLNRKARFMSRLGFPGRIEAFRIGA